MDTDRSRIMKSKHCLLAGFLLLAALLPAGAQRSVEDLRDKGIFLPAPNRPIANYITAVRTGDLLFLSGHGYCGSPSPIDTGKVGRDLTVEQGYQAARNVGLCMLATLQDQLGDLARVKRVIRVSGMVNATDDFTRHPEVMNGFSDLLVEVFGEAGKHVRAAVGMCSLPRNMAVEVEMLVELNP